MGLEHGRGDGPEDTAPKSPIVGVFQRGSTGVSIIPKPSAAPPAAPSQPVQTGPLSRPTPESTASPPSESPPKDVLRATLVRDFQDKLAMLEQLHRALPTADHYALLGVHSAAGPREIRAAYTNLMRPLHLDAYFRENVGEDREKLHAVVSALTSAYDALRRPRARWAYDESLGISAAERYFAQTPDGLCARQAAEPTESAEAAHHFEAIAPPRPDNVSLPSLRPSARPGKSATPARTPSNAASGRPPQSMRPTSGLPARPSPSPPVSAIIDQQSIRPRERASRAAHAEREAFTEPPKESIAPSPSGQRDLFPVERTNRGAIPMPLGEDQESQALDQGPLPSLLELAHQRRFGGGLSAWTAARLREASQAEGRGQKLEAYTILCNVLNQVRDSRIAAHAARLRPRAE